MKPLKLTMQAFGSYGKQTSINFEEPNQNLFLITGDTGAGKTTIFDAIVFALYGEASSTVNKKDGAELQSQYVKQKVKPFVELTFSEGMGESRGIYTVCRVPRHKRPLKRGEGVTDERESVSLIMPDGSEYPQKETDKKLEEIVGLTKSQFMQVAMIAQGEFMELLRAKSDVKKVIFRKLFGTEIFQNIVDELGERKKKQEKEIAKIRTVFQTEAAHIQIPKDHERAEELSALKRRITTAARLSITDMEELLEELAVLCEELKAEEKLACQRYREASNLRDKKRDFYAGAEHLLKFFEQLEEAEAELVECQKAEESMKMAEVLIGKLRAAYEIRAEFQRYEDTLEAETAMRARQKEQQMLLPGLEMAAEEAKEKETEIKKIFEQELESFSRTMERVEKARRLFDKIEDVKRETVEKKEIFQEAESIAEEKRKKLSDLEEQEKVWRRQYEELCDTEKRLALWKVKCGEAEAMEKEWEEERKQQQDVERQRKSAKKAREDYAAASESYAGESARYESMRKEFLDAQAGVLARELRPGIPCPVCGALEHPAPCHWEERAEKLSREVIDAMEKKVSELQKEQERRSGEARSKTDLLREKEKILERMSSRLRAHMAKNIAGISEEMASEQMEKVLADWRKSVRREGEQIKKEARILARIQQLLQGIDSEKEKRREQAEQAQKGVREAEAAWERSRAALESLEKGRDYLTEEDVCLAENEAKQKKQEVDMRYRKVRMEAEKAGKTRDQARTLIQKYTQELPEKEKQRAERQAAYEKMLEQKNLSETEWKELTEKHGRDEADSLQKTVDLYNRKKTSALRMQADAKKAVENRERPVLEDMKREMEEAEERRKDAQSILERCKAEYKTNTEIYSALKPQMDERKRMVEEHTKLDHLYRLLSGNVTGSRMDLETYVQRYYLERVLYAANRRFQEMSAGQFELRMYELEKAGEGKNRGLDLMVYSTVTGKEREIRTLSGGESFMAALSLALGMADQIQETSAAIHLDVMFIDEGFGSLDERSRNQAVRVLQEMAGGSKLIGIISHVTELKQEIENQLIVRKDENGSYVRWQIS